MDAAAIRREAIPDQYRRRCRGPTAEPRVNWLGVFGGL